MPAATHTKLPLESLFAYLRKENFEITTSNILDVQKVLANLDESSVHLDSLPFIIGPLICRNKEEQERFYKTCDQYLQSLKKEIEKTEPLPKQKPKIPRFIYLVIAALIGLVALFFILRDNKPKEQTATLVIQTEDASGGFAFTDNIYFLVNWDDTAKNENYQYEWTINARKYTDRIVTVKFDRPGTYFASVNVLSFGGKLIRTLKDSITLACEKTPAVEIQKENEGISSRIIYTPAFSNEKNKGSDYSYRWYVNNKFASAQKILSGEFQSDTGYTVKLVVDWNKGLHCSIDSLVATREELPNLVPTLTGISPLIIQSKTIWANWAWMIAGLLLIPSIAAFFVFRYQRNKRRKEQEEINRLQQEQNKVNYSQSPQQSTEERKYTGPYTIEFASQDEKIFEESGISQLAETLRKRHSSDTYTLHINKTIRQTIRGGGFPSLQFVAKTAPTDFLILLDKEYPEGHITKLFSWVIGKLKKEEVQFTFYSFYKEPLLLSNESMNHRLLPIDKLARLYPDSILLIFSQASGFFNAYHPVVKRNIAEKFRNWDTKLLITPSPKNDWTSKELALYEAGFTVIPADINAHKIIEDEINYMIDKQKLKKSIVPDSYGSRSYNFNRWKQLDSYIRRATETDKTGTYEAVKKWITATAVYPHINWNITIAIGKAIEEKKYKQGELVNYTNLLILSRILWMNNGQVPESLRQESLVQLDKETEAIARNAVTKALKEIEPTIKSDSLVADEFVYLNTTNKFLLHTSNPSGYDLSRPEYERMKDYVHDGQLDWVLEEYLSNPSNSTLLHKPGTTNSVPPKMYFDSLKKEDENYEGELAILEAERERKRKLAAQWEKTKDRLRVAASFLTIAIIAALLLWQRNIFNNLVIDSPNDIFFKLTGNSSGQNLTNYTIRSNINGKTYTSDVVNDSMLVLMLVNSGKQTTGIFEFARDGYSYTTNGDTLYRYYTVSFGKAAAKPKLFVRYASNDGTTSQILDYLNTRYTVSSELQADISTNRLIYYNPQSKSTADSIVSSLKDILKSNVSVEYIPENRTPPAPPMLFLNASDTTTTAGTDPPTAACTNIDLKQLPNSLTEIWSGSSNNRLIRFDLTRYRIFYSTGSITTYGTYSIVKACLDNGNYKLIVKGDKTFRQFNVRNVQSKSFELNLCQQEYDTEAEAERATDCGTYQRMKLYYLLNPNYIYLPLDLQDYETSELQKIKNIESASSTYKLQAMINSLNNLPSRTQQDQLIRQSTKMQQFKNVTWSAAKTSTGSPFERNYITLTTVRDHRDGDDQQNPPIQQQDLNFSTLATIEFGANEDQNMGKMQTSFLYTLSRYLRDNPSASVTISLRYSGTLGSKRAATRVKAVTDAIKYAGPNENQISINSVPSRGGKPVENGPYEDNLDRLVITCSKIPDNDIKTLKSSLSPKGN